MSSFAYFVQAVDWGGAKFMTLCVSIIPNHRHPRSLVAAYYLVFVVFLPRGESWGEGGFPRVKIGDASRLTRLIWSHCTESVQDKTPLFFRSVTAFVNCFTIVPAVIVLGLEALFLLVTLLFSHLTRVATRPLIFSRQVSFPG